MFGVSPAISQQISIALVMRNRGEQLESVLKAILRREVQTFEMEFAGFHFGEVENVVKQVKKGFRGGVDHAEIFPLLGIEGGIGEEAGHPEDAIHRSANFVAHVSEEFSFGLTGGFRRSFRAAEGFLFLFSLGDVDETDDGADDMSVATDGMGPDFDTEAGTIGAPEGLIEFVKISAGLRTNVQITIVQRNGKSRGVGMVTEQMQVPTE